MPGGHVEDESRSSSARWLVSRCEMKIPEIDLEICVASRLGAGSVVDSEPDRWCVISIRGPLQEKAALVNAKEVVELIFDDVITDDRAAGQLGPRLEHATGIIQAAERFAGQ